MKEGYLNSGIRALVLAGALAVPISISATQVFLYLAVFLWLIIGCRKRKRYEFNRPWTIFIGLFLLAVFGSVIAGERPGESLAETHRLFLLAFIFILPSLMVHHENPGERDVRLLLILFVAGTVLLSVWDIFRVRELTGQGVPLADTGNMRDPQFYMVALCLLLATWIGNPAMKIRLILVLPVLLSLAGLWLHQKRGAWFALAAAVLCVVAYTRRWKLLLGLAILAAGLLAVPPVRHATLDRLGNLQEEFSVSHGERLSIWVKVAPQLIRDHPFGIGFKSTDYLDFKEYAKNIAPGINHLHDNLLQVAAEVGWFGALVWLGWMAAVLVMLLKSMATFRKNGHAGFYPALGVCAGFLALMLNGIVEYNFGDSEIYMLMCLFMGLCNVFWLQRQVLLAGGSAPFGPDPVQ